MQRMLLRWHFERESRLLYASKAERLTIRYLTTWVNACWGIGQLLALAVLRGLLPRQDDWGWRIPYALQVGDLHHYLGVLSDEEVDVASTSLHRRFLCPGITLVAGKKRPIRRRETISDSIDECKRKGRFRC